LAPSRQSGNRPVPVGRRALGDDLQHVVGQAAIVAALNQQAARDRLHHQARARRVGQLARQQQAQILLLGEDSPRLRARVGRHHHLGEDARDRFCRLGVERAVAGDDTAEGRHRVAGERRLIGLEQRLAARHAAGVGVLDDDDRRRTVDEFADQLQRGIGVVQLL
jgi:hypothetical protein